MAFIGQRVLGVMMVHAWKEAKYVQVRASFVHVPVAELE
jgi:hypothetical protein